MLNSINPRSETMPPDQYPSPTAAQVSAGAGPFFGQNNGNNDGGPPQIPTDLQQLQQSMEMNKHQNASQQFSQQAQHALNNTTHDFGTHPHDNVDQSLDEALRQPTSPERLAQSVMNMSQDPSGYPQHPQHPGDAMQADMNAGGSKIKRTKVSRACDECRRKKIRCDASDTSDEPCSSCRRTGAACRFSRQPMKRGPSKGYIKELADRLNTLESQLGPHAGAQQAAEAYAQGFDSLGDLSQMSHDFGSPNMQAPPEQQTPGGVAQMGRKRTHSESENWGRDQSGYTPARQAANAAWAESAKFLGNPYGSGGMQPQPPQGLQSDGKQVSPMARGLDFGPALGSARRLDGLPFEAEGREDETGAHVEWDETVIDEYYRLIHQTFPILLHSKTRLRVKLGNCPPTLREAFLVALDCAVRTSPSTHLQSSQDPRQNTKRAAELLLASQYENTATRTFMSSLIYIQTVILLALESENEGPATMRGEAGPPRSEWLGRAIGMAVHLKLNMPRTGERYAEGDTDADLKIGRRLWWILFIMDRWHASSSSSSLQIPESSATLVMDDLPLMGESTYHLARLSFIIGHLSTLTQQTPTPLSPPTPTTSLLTTLLTGELSRFRESIESLLVNPPPTHSSYTNTTLISLAYWHVRLLITRLLPASIPAELIIPVAKMTALLNNEMNATTPLHHHFAALAALTCVELLGMEETRERAEQCLGEVEEALTKSRVNAGFGGWDMTIRELIAKGATKIGASRGLQHLADAAIAGKGEGGGAGMHDVGLHDGDGDAEGDDAETSPEAAAAAAAAAAVGATGHGHVHGHGHGHGDDDNGLGMSGLGGENENADGEVFDQGMALRLGYLATLAHN